jgi:hypothetical protein
MIEKDKMNKSDVPTQKPTDKPHKYSFNENNDVNNSDSKNIDLMHYNEKICTVNGSFTTSQNEI